MRFHLRRIHFFAGNIYYIRSPTNESESVRLFLQQVVGDKKSAAKFCFVGFRKITVAHSGTAHANPARGRVWINHLNGDAFHRLTDKTFFLVLSCAVITHSTAFRRAVKRMYQQSKFLPELPRHCDSPAPT